MINKNKELTDKDKALINAELLKSQGVLRDYDNNELMHPLSISILAVLETMKENAKSLL